MLDTAQASTPVAAASGWHAVRVAAGRSMRPGALHLVLLIGILDLVWNRRAGLTFTGWPASLIALAILLGVWIIYRTIRPVPALAELSLYAALWVGFSIAAVISTYLAAAVARPLQDTALAAFDARLGFDWAAWTHAVRLHPATNLVLRLAYDSLVPQIVGSIALFAFLRVRGRNEELLMTAAVALVLTSLISALLPALGPCDTSVYLPHLLELRGVSPPAFPLAEMQGIVTFPSYHTVLALLFVYAHRGLRRSLPLVFALNGLMLISVPSEGGHYLADMVAGAAVALLAVSLVRMAGPAASPAR